MVHFKLATYISLHVPEIKETVDGLIPTHYYYFKIRDIHAKMIEKWPQTPINCIPSLYVGHMWQGMRKRDHFAHFLNFHLKKNAYISGTIAAMNFKPGMNILPSSCYTCCKLRAHPHPVWAGEVSASIVFENCRFMPQFGGSLLGTGGLL